MKHLEVVAALIWDKNRFLICQRPKDKGCALLWEFVGGKVEPGESHEQALVRECREELGIQVLVGNEFMDVTHEYPDAVVHLTLYEATIVSGIPQRLEHQDFQWILPDEISQYPFCPADRAILERIQQIVSSKE